MEYRDNLEMARQLAVKVSEAGGTVYYVGGFVRDHLMGYQSKDIDIEVHGILPEQLEAILDQLGERQMFGASFGIYNLRHYDLDIAMPRKEQKTGEHHRDFRCEIDPFCGTEKAAVRRDFTINAMMQNVLTGEIIDHFGGQRDLDNGIIRHVNEDSFAEDALRVLRAAQFAARFGFQIAPETLALCRKMNLIHLAGERIQEEMNKALLKARRPSVFFEQLRLMDQLGFWFRELKALIGVPQSPVYHPEGNAWQHTMLVTDGAASLREKASKPLAFMLSAVMHDCGKPVTTVTMPNGKISSIGHEVKGTRIAEQFMERIHTDNKTQQYVMNMILLHMKPNLLPAQHAGTKAYMKMLDDSVSPEDLLLLSKADRIGQMTDMNAYQETEKLLQSMLRRYRDVLQKTQEVSGRDLVRAGYRSGPQFSEILEYSHKLWLAGIPYEDALKQTLSYAAKIQNTEKADSSK
ncbi:MAG: HD domain-containing protein [Clostridia bacterium]|nr:HD domain-containing protein [Clostridia bacterium]